MSDYKLISLQGFPLSIFEPFIFNWFYFVLVYIYSYDVCGSWFWLEISTDDIASSSISSMFDCALSLKLGVMFVTYSYYDHADI